MIHIKRGKRLLNLILISGFVFAQVQAVNVPEKKKGWFSRFDFFGFFKKRNEVIDALYKKKRRPLKGKKILITCNHAPNNDVPSFGFGDAFLYFPRLCEYLQQKGADVAIRPPRPLTAFFRKCSDLKVVQDDVKGEYTKVDCSELLQAIKNFQHFRSKKRYLIGKNSRWAEGLVNSLADKFRRENIIPVVVTRQASKLPWKYALRPKFSYMNNRSMSREDLEKSLRGFLGKIPQRNILGFWSALTNVFVRKRPTVAFYNIQFEDQKKPNITGIQKPTSVWSGYANRRGAFVNDAIFMKAALQAGGKIVSVDTAAANLAIGIPEVGDQRRNVFVALAKEHNSRWKGNYINQDGSSAWSNNIVLLTQKRSGNWESAFALLIKKLLKQLRSRGARING